MMLRKFKPKLLALGLSPIVAISCYTPNVSAQEQSSEAATNTLETIVVTARQRQESLIDVPLAVSVANKETLERDQIVELNDLARVTPALQVNQTFGGEDNGGGRIRGIGTGVFNHSVSPSVAYQVDGLPQGNLSFRGLYDLQQVEVLRGPQGTLFGQGASAGVINISTVEPNFDGVTGDLTIDYAGVDDLGSESGRTLITAGVNLPVSETFALRVAAQSNDEDGLQTNLFTGKRSNTVTNSLRFKSLWEAAPNLTVKTKFEFNEQEYDGRDFLGFDNVNPPDPINTPINPFAPPGTTFGAVTIGNLTRGCGITLETLNDYSNLYCSEIDFDQEDSAFTFGNVVEYEFGEYSLTAVTSYRTLDRDLVGANFSGQVVGLAARDENLKEESEQFTQEFRLNFGGENWDTIIGAFYSKYDYELSQLDEKPLGSSLNGTRTGFSLCTSDNSGFAPFPGAPNCLPGAGTDSPATADLLTVFESEDTSSDTLALFVDTTYQVDDQWDVFGGLRVSDYSSETNLAIPQIGARSTLETGETNVSGRIGARFKPSDDVTYYGSVSSGYKPSAVVVSPVLPDVTLDEEKSVALELGAKWALENSTLEANIFHTTLDGFQEQVNEFIESSLVSTAVNLDDIKSSGIELTAYGNVSDSLTYNVGYAYNKIEYPSGFIGDDGFELSGEQYTYAPKHKLTLSGEYSRSISENLSGFVNANVIYQSETQFAAIDPAIARYDATTHVGGAFGVRSEDGRWSLSVFGRNLTEERQPVAYLPQPFPDGATRSWAVPGITGKIIGLKLDVNFE